MDIFEVFEKNDIAEVQRLIKEEGYDVNAKDIEGKTALMLSAEKGWEKVVKLLLEKNADVNAKNIYNSNALILATANRHVNCVKLLLEYGVNLNLNVNATDNEGQNALMIAASKGYTEGVTLLIEHVNLEATDKYGKTALMLAAENLREQCINVLVDRGVDVNAKCEGGRNALDYTFEGFSLELAELSKKNNSTTWKKEQGYKVVKFLLKAQCSLSEFVSITRLSNSSIEKLTTTPLSSCCIMGCEEIAKLLTESYQINVNASDNKGQTALVWAVKNNNVAIVKLLLGVGTYLDVNCVDSDGRTPLIFATIMKYEEIKELLKEAISKSTLQSEGGSGGDDSSAPAADGVDGAGIARDHAEDIPPG